MNKAILILMFLLATGLFAAAQDSSLHATIVDSAIKVSVIQHGRFSSVLYTSNGMPLTKKGIEQRLLRYPDAALEWEKYKQSRHTTLFFGCLCVASAITAAIEYNQRNTGASHVFIGLSISGLLAEFIAGAQGPRHCNRAIEVYNAHFQ